MSNIDDIEMHIATLLGVSSATRRYVMGDRMMGDATSEEEAARNRVATLVADRDTALMARDEVGIQYQAAQAEIARMRPVVEAVRFARAGGLCQSAAVDYALRAFDAVPGDALATALKVETYTVEQIRAAFARACLDASTPFFSRWPEIANAVVDALATSTKKDGE